MKKIFCYAAALATMLFAASCQKETLFGGQGGDEVTATLTIQAPEQLVTKAVGDGQTADNLVFAVFDENGEELGRLNFFSTIQQSHS